MKHCTQTTPIPFFTHRRLFGMGLLTSACALLNPSWAQGSGLPSTAPEASAQAAQINPLTGQSMASEALARELTRLKLEAEVYETRVKLAKSQGDLALATLRQEAEQRRLRTEIRGGADMTPSPEVMPPTPATRSAPAARGPVLELQPAPLPQSDGTRSNSMPSAPAIGLETRTTPNRAEAASTGYVYVGGEKLSVQDFTSGTSNTFMVQAVDQQARPPQQLIPAAMAATEMGMPRLSMPVIFPPGSPASPMPSSAMESAPMTPPPGGRSE